MMIAVLKGMKRLFSRNSGYTLLEIAAVVAVTGTLALVAIPIVQNKLEQGKEVAAVESLKKVCSAVSDYYADVGVLPTNDGSTTGNIIRTSESAGIEATTASAAAGWSGAGNVLIASADVLTKNGASEANWNGPYLAEEELLDPWGNPFYVTVDATWDDDADGGTTPEVTAAVFGVCAGSDGDLNVIREQNYDNFDPGSDDFVIRIR
jgi:Tfp pilus assembly major pilin PilA